MLAMDVNDDSKCQDERGAWAFFASKLAPTGGDHCHSRRGGLKADLALCSTALYFSAAAPVSDMYTGSYS